MATLSSNLHISEYMVPVHQTASQEIVAAADDGQEAGPSGRGRPQSALSGASVVTAASDEEDEGGVSISVQMLKIVSFPHMYSSIGVLYMSTEQYSENIPVENMMISNK